MCDTLDTTGLPKNPHNFSSIETSPSEVYDILLSLPKKKAPGWDGITTDLLRLCATGISESLATLFNRSFSDGVFPAAWKLALVTPVFKKGCMDEQLQTNCVAFGCWQSV